MSRSVITPMGRSDVSSTGISPQSFSTISRATSSSVAFGEQHAGSGVITSRASLAIGPPLRLLIAFGRVEIDRTDASRAASDAPLGRSSRAGYRFAQDS